MLLDVQDTDPVAPIPTRLLLPIIQHAIASTMRNLDPEAMSRLHPADTALDLRDFRYWHLQLLNHHAMLRLQLDLAHVHTTLTISELGDLLKECGAAILATARPAGVDVYTYRFSDDREDRDDLLRRVSIDAKMQPQCPANNP
jgi:hypothetical protein